MSDRLAHLSRRSLLAGLAASAAQAGIAAPLVSARPRARPAGLGPVPMDARALIARAGLGGEVGFVLADAATGQVIETENPLLPLPPASVTKALTAYYALSTLGPFFRYSTELIATGPIENGQVMGDLILAGSGDPTLDTDALGRLAAALGERGVRKVKGRFLVYDGALPFIRAIDPGQPDHVGYSPAISGLNLNYNRVHFEWKRAAQGYDITLQARSRRFQPDVSTAHMQVVERDLPVFSYSSKSNVDQWSVARRALGKGGARWLPVRVPARYAADVFQTLARASGTPLPRAEFTSQKPSGTTIAAVESVDLPLILRDMLKYSTNITAEAVGLRATQARQAAPAALAGSAHAMCDWLRSAAGVHHVDLVDHSGLGDRSRVSARDMARVLIAAKAQLRPLMKDRPLKDAKGRPINGGAARIQAKTGTLNFVSTLAGYVTASDGTEMVFAIFTADQQRRAGIAPENRERPSGARAWARRSRNLQNQLLTRWTQLYTG